jgi:hypothetical protein
MHHRALALFAVSLLTASCSYHYTIAAVERAGAIVFEPRDDKGTGCFSDFSVAINDGPVVWKLRVDKYLAPPCQSKFPITYGVKPAGMFEEVKAAPLQPGMTYKVEGWDGDSYSGLFRLEQGITIENLSEQR